MPPVLYIFIYIYIYIYIKTSGNELRGQEEAVCTRISGLRDHYSDFFAWMVGLKF